jgi:hypothetical protein
MFRWDSGKKGGPETRPYGASPCWHHGVFEAQPFDPALRDLRMNRAVARFTSSAPSAAARGSNAVDQESEERSFVAALLRMTGPVERGEARLGKRKTVGD